MSDYLDGTTSTSLSGALLNRAVAQLDGCNHANGLISDFYGYVADAAEPNWVNDDIEDLIVKGCNKFTSSNNSYL